MDETAVRQVAMAFPEATEQPHFDRTSFRVQGKIFATMNAGEKRLSVKLSEKEQDLFCSFDEMVMYPVPNKWGKRGWTVIDLEKIPAEMCTDALRSAYCEVAPRKLVELWRAME